jgi:hypothetical protein
MFDKLELVAISRLRRVVKICDKLKLVEHCGHCQRYNPGDE